MTSRQWQVQEAKTDLSALIRAAEARGPQTITRNGKAVAVVVSVHTFEKLTNARRARKGSLLDFFASWPPLEVPERDRNDVGRDIRI